ncbi:hypothetical protein [Thermomonospora cellulosilytica]|uniref:Uncharacterized protein n=1 Tax=Thermomonospora cellulosilytica TaxID=1411118 RepID=A0A7W3MW90_9ACTN|nr:hypothetical protein [Thermomonospora cellulosilytica]MBA9003038.1 hypothetical protein [Thermomonospora cellulosilytica]
MSRQQTFVAACLAGDALIVDIDDWVDRWHDEAGAPGGQQITLADYLGLTPEEYELWVERPESLRFVLSSRRNLSGVSPHIGRDIKLLAAAARAANDEEAASVLAWLQQTGRIA